MALIKVKVETKAAYWVVIDQIDIVTTKDGTSHDTIDLLDDSQHVLVYWFVGDPSEKIKITVIEDDTNLKIWDDNLPKNPRRLPAKGAGNFKFTTRKAPSA